MISLRHNQALRYGFRELSPPELRLVPRIRAFLRYGVTIFLALLAGCSSPRPEQMSETAVILRNRTPQEISTVTKETFKRHHFEEASGQGGELVFQRKGSAINDVMSPNWLDGPTWIRVRVIQHPLDAERTVLDYRAYLVQQPEDPMFETGKPYTGHKKEFKKLLQEIGRRLSQSTTAPGQ